VYFSVLPDSGTPCGSAHVVGCKLCSSVLPTQAPNVDLDALNSELAELGLLHEEQVSIVQVSHPVCVCECERPVLCAWSHALCLFNLNIEI
jgi:predicted metal-binding protein